MKRRLPALSPIIATSAGRCRPKRIVLMGDSAGGGLSLALAQALGPGRLAATPGHIVLLSPWLDLTIETIRATLGAGSP